MCITISLSNKLNRALSLITNAGNLGPIDCILETIHSLFFLSNSCMRRLLIKTGACTVRPFMETFKPKDRLRVFFMLYSNCSPFESTIESFELKLNI